MRRRDLAPRLGWEKIVEEQGLLYHSPLGRPYWNESAYYEFTMAQVLQIEEATEQLWQLSLKAAEYAISTGRLGSLGIPAEAHPFVYKSWEEEPPSIYGRFDLAYDGVNPPKLLEFNADTPTALLEAAVIQWFWKEERFPKADQFNSLHEKLIAKWIDLAPYLAGSPVFFTHLDNWEDWVTISYLRQTAAKGGVSSEQILLSDLGWNADGTVRDLKDQPIRSIFKLYPWEWLLQEIPTGESERFFQTQWVEPLWKLILSNKAFLALLWELYPDSPYLLPAHLEGPRSLEAYVVKPIHSREGSNIRIVSPDFSQQTDGPYESGGQVFQALFDIPQHSGRYPVIGSWYITDQGPAGMGIRESTTRITDNLSQFVPHIIEG